MAARKREKNWCFNSQKGLDVHDDVNKKMGANNAWTLCQNMLARDYEEQLCSGGDFCTCFWSVRQASWQTTGQRSFNVPNPESPAAGHYSSDGSPPSDLADTVSTKGSLRGCLCWECPNCCVSLPTCRCYLSKYQTMPKTATDRRR